MKVLMVTSDASERNGGIYYALKDLTSALCARGIEVEVLAGSSADGQVSKADWAPARIRLEPVVGPRFFAWQPGLPRAINDAGADVLHIHGLWQYPSLAATHALSSTRPRLISPHGMLDPWAVAHSAWKKRLVSVLYEQRNLSSAAALHALCKAEHEAIRRYGLTNAIATIPNGVDLGIAAGSVEPPVWAHGVPAGSKVMLFLGRIHPKKGLLPLLQAFARLPELEREGWHLVVAGWDQGGHRQELETAVKKLGLQRWVHFVGPLFGERKYAALAGADAFVLPSLSEGLPMAVLEAWAFSLPTVLTPECNLPEGFTSGAALRVSTRVPELASSLRQFFELGDGAREEMGRRGRELVQRSFSWPSVAARFTELYRWVLGGGAAPDFVEVPRAVRSKGKLA